MKEPFENILFWGRKAHPVSRCQDSPRLSVKLQWILWGRRTTRRTLWTTEIAEYLYAKTHREEDDEEDTVDGPHPDAVKLMGEEDTVDVKLMGEEDDEEDTADGPHPDALDSLICSYSFNVAYGEEDDEEDHERNCKLRQLQMCPR